MMYYFEVICIVLVINTVFLMLRLRKWIRIAALNRHKYLACDWVRHQYWVVLLNNKLAAKADAAVREAAEVAAKGGRFWPLPKGWKNEL